jgi:hypothetical protein
MKTTKKGKKPKVKRPMVVEAYMTHARTPFITEVLRNGRVRKIARYQRMTPGGWELELAQTKALYGDRWTGVRTIKKGAK